MGIWIELGLFVLVLAFGLWALADSRCEKRTRQASHECGTATNATNTSILAGCLGNACCQ